jgi:1-deoxy-D-xylulose-5-phosphate reductoisomerase
MMRTELKQAATLTLLGSTGSIGESTLAVVREVDNLSIFALSANRNVDKLLAQCLEFSPRYAVLCDPSLPQERRDEFSRALHERGCKTELLLGAAALEEVASAAEVDMVMAAIVGAAGLASTLAAAKAGKRLLLANKEALVMTGDILLDAARQSGATLLPIDSEHNAIFQCLPTVPEGVDSSQFTFVEKIVLTASGGPFLRTPLDQFAAITPAQACAHPVWSMGDKISIDSATMMNKGLEYIEACYLFGLPSAKVEVVIHPQSVVHSMVHYDDGSVLAQMASPDMRVPIAHCLAWPQRIKTQAPRLDLTQQAALEFYAPDLDRFPCLALGMEAAKVSGTAPALLNAANEVAVASFLSGALDYLGIAAVNAEVMAQMPCEAATSLAIIHEADARARDLASALIKKRIL